MDPQRIQTPRKASRPKKAASQSDQSESSRRGGRRGGRSGSAAHQHRQQQASSAAYEEDNGGSFDENGTFIPAVSTPQQAQRISKKRVGQDSRTPQPPVEQTMPVPIQQSPFTQTPFLGTPPQGYYAGPAFHQSPAASALPMPRFLSKSVPRAAGATSLADRAERLSDSSSSVESSPAPSPSVHSARPNPGIQDGVIASPLDKLFTAARAETAQRRSSAVHLDKAAPSSASRNNGPPPASHWASIYGSKPVVERTASTDGSQGGSRGIFALDMEATTPRSTASSLVAPVPSPGVLHRTVSDGMQHLQQNHHGNQVYTAPTSSSPNHGLPGPSSHSTSLATSQAPVQHFAQHTPVSRSASHTPLHTPSHDAGDPQSFHYGNKNLSPMFQATRTSSPRTQSRLRNQVGVGGPSEQPGIHGAAIPFPQYGQYGGPPGGWKERPIPHQNQTMTAGQSPGGGASTQVPMAHHGAKAASATQTEDHSAKMQMLSENLRSMLNIPKSSS